MKKKVKNLAFKKVKKTKKETPSISKKDMDVIIDKVYKLVYGKIRYEQLHPYSWD